MKIPHLEPVKFAKEILDVEETKAEVYCEFPTTPSLAMIFEAAAQSSAAFSQNETKIGFLISVKDTELLDANIDNNILIRVEKKAAFGAICEFSFLAMSLNKDKLFAKGILTVMIQE